MAESESGAEKSEQPTARRLDEMISSGQFAKSLEIQTVVMLGAGVMILTLMAPRIFQDMRSYMAGMFSQLATFQVTEENMPWMFGHFFSVAGVAVLPVMIAAVLAAVMSGGFQSRFQLTPKSLDPNWNKLNPINGFKSLFSMQSIVRLVLSFFKLVVIVGMTYPVIKSIMSDPIFYESMDFSHLLVFMVTTAQSVALRVLAGMVLIAIADYGYQLWKTDQDSLMTKEEVKEESKNTEGNPTIRSEQKRRRRDILRQNWAREIPRADVIITNPTHLAIALRYDRKKMGAPRVVAKGARFNALRIREIAKQNQIPILENKPVARLLFKHCKVGQEIVPDLYAAVAEILAFVYRTNRYRYYRQGLELPR